MMYPKSPYESHWDKRIAFLELGPIFKTWVKDEIYLNQKEDLQERDHCEEATLCMNMESKVNGENTGNCAAHYLAT